MTLSIIFERMHFSQAPPRNPPVSFLVRVINSPERETWFLRTVTNEIFSWAVVESGVVERWNQIPHSTTPPLFYRRFKLFPCLNYR
jgi:hypothetical protein